MTIKEELVAGVSLITTARWETQDARTIPDLAALPLGNAGKNLDACILYADLSDSTQLVDNAADFQAAEYYKAFLLCASKLIVSNGGSIEAYDGDRVMGVFLGDARADSAVSAALEINYAVQDIVNPQFAEYYASNHHPLQHTVGIDTGRVLVCKAGVRGDNDLVWVGPAANYAAKLNSFKGLDHNYPTRITTDVLALLERWVVSANGTPLWQGPYHNVGKPHYRSNFWLPLA